MSGLQAKDYGLVDEVISTREKQSGDARKA
jgi:hypothetical protein